MREGKNELNHEKGKLNGEVKGSNNGINGLNRERINAGIRKRQIILDLDGQEYYIDNKNEDINCAWNFEILCPQVSDRNILRKFILDENGMKGAGSSPESIKAMKRLELVDYEPASDSGHFRFYPKGNLVFDLIKDWADEIALGRLKSLKIETPLLYNYDEPDIKQQVESFHERHYVVDAPDRDKEYILRFAGDFGLFRMMKDVSLSYRHLPLRVYEYSKSFRYEKSGELAGLKRLRAFSMPDIHSFTRNLQEGFVEYKEIYKHYYDLARAMEVQFVVAFRVVESFFREHKEEIQELVSYGGTPVFIELLSDMKHYWAMKCEFQSMDGNGGFVQLSTVQLDIKDARIYGINYIDADGSKKGCIICHSSIGSIERWMYAILEESLMRAKPELPYWLSPVQLRLIPVKPELTDHCLHIADRLRRDNVRMDVDDREERLGKKIRDAEQSWIPFMMVVGMNEKEKGLYTLRERSGEELKNNTLEQIAEIMGKLQDGMPFRCFNMNPLLSRQPLFRG